MPYSVELRDTVIWIRLFGALSDEDLLEGMAKVSSLEEQLNITPARICDIDTTAKMKFGFVEILSLASLRRTRNFKNSFKSALVARTKAHVGFARMFQTLNNNPQIDIRIFSDPESAFAWVSSAS